MVWMGLWWLLAIALVAAFAWALLKAGTGSRSAPKDSPEDVVKRRYASGEINRETFQKMLTDLKS